MRDEPYINNPGPKTPVTGLSAAASTDNEIVTETILKVLGTFFNPRISNWNVDTGLFSCLLN